MLKDGHDDDLTVVRAFLQNQRAQGIIRPDIDIHSLSFGIIGLYYGLRAGLIIGDDASDVKWAWVDTIKAMICPVPEWEFYCHSCLLSVLAATLRPPFTKSIEFESESLR